MQSPEIQYFLFADLVMSFVHLYETGWFNIMLTRARH
jgi:hypothetical protein